MIRRDTLEKRDYTRILLIRHGETVDEDTKKVFKGTIDIPLSATGISTIERVADYLKIYNLDYVYTSALSRAVESGKIIAEPHNLDIIVESRLNEIHFGQWEGLNFSEIEKLDPHFFMLWLQDPEKYTPPGGESLAHAQKRIMDKFAEIEETHRGKIIAIVAHAGVLRIIIASVFSLKLSNMFRFAQDYGCIDIVDIYEDSNAVVKLLNFRVNK